MFGFLSLEMAGKNVTRDWLKKKIPYVNLLSKSPEPKARGRIRSYKTVRVCLKCTLDFSWAVSI